MFGRSLFLFFAEELYFYLTFLSQHCEQIRVYQTCIGNECFIMECCLIFIQSVWFAFSLDNFKSKAVKVALCFYYCVSIRRNAFSFLCFCFCLLHTCVFCLRSFGLFFFTLEVTIISMGIVGVKSTAGREVKFVDPSMTTRGESAWLGYTLCDSTCRVD